MNQGMELSRAEFGIFLNADATPQGNNWLRPLVEALQNPKTGAVFGRQIPRPDCRAVYANDYERCFGENRESAGWEHFFSMVSSGLRKDIWAKRGFLETMQYSEDDEYTRWCRAQEYQVAYCPESIVMHSHNYTPHEAYKRSFGEARALAAVWPHPPEEINWPRTAFLGWLNDVRRDLVFCRQNGRLKELPHAAWIRWNQRRARLEGFRAGWEHYRGKPRPDERSRAIQRFTIDGDEQLEERLAGICEKVSRGIQKIIPTGKLEAVVLGGGYGRAQGGVLRSKDGDLPYNDLEFYVFVRGNPVWQERTHGAPLDELGRQLSAEAGLHVEFKIDSIERLRRGPVSMFSYDLVSGHRVVFGAERIFAGCEQHLDASKIPLSEATRLLFNRCSGLLLVRELCGRATFTPEEADFIGRNLAKAQLALGDALLTVFGQYHWDCTERHRRLVTLVRGEAQPGSSEPPFSWLEIQNLHAKGVRFKLHPHCDLKERSAFEEERRHISGIAAQVWLWLESRRLGRQFNSVQEYAMNDAAKCDERRLWRNRLVTLKAFGKKALIDPIAWRYPRERLLNSLPLLLWNGEVEREPEVARHLQRQLLTSARDWQGFVTAYKEVWQSFS
jgi:rhamnosyltransferase